MQHQIKEVIPFDSLLKKSQPWNLDLGCPRLAMYLFKTMSQRLTKVLNYHAKVQRHGCGFIDVGCC